MNMLAAFLLFFILISTALSSEDAAREIEAITAISLPVDSVTIYPDGLVTMKRNGTMNVAEGVHEFAVDVPWFASEESILLWVSDATIEKIVYETIPVYTVNVSTTGEHEFLLSYLMYDSGYWWPRYSLQLGEDTLLISAIAVVENYCEEDLENVSVKLVTGITPAIETDYLYDILYSLVEEEMAYDYGYEEEYTKEPAPAEYAPYEKSLDEPATGELETLFIFELKGRNDLEMDSRVGLPLFEEEIPIERIYTWDADIRRDGPVTEEIKVNNTMDVPWPSGTALLYRNGEYVSTINIPYTPVGSDESIVVGSSADLTVLKELKEYTVQERFLNATENSTEAIKETTETWKYQLKVTSEIDRAAAIEVTDSRPMEALMIEISPEPVETTATSLKWEIALEPRQEVLIEYSYKIITTETVEQQLKKY